MKIWSWPPTHTRAHTHTHTYTPHQLPTHVECYPQHHPSGRSGSSPLFPWGPCKNRTEKTGKEETIKNQPTLLRTTAHSTHCILRTTTAPPHSSLTHVGPWPSHPCLNIPCAPYCVLPSPERQSLIYVNEVHLPDVKVPSLLLPIRTYNYY